MWPFFSRDAGAQFPYTIGDEVGSDFLSGKSVFRLYDGESRKGEKVSVFVCDNPAFFESAKLAVRRLKTLKHPSILTFVESSESDKGVFLATERVRPLCLHIDKDLDGCRGPARDWYIAWGIYSLVKAWAFLNVEAKLKHNNFQCASIFVNAACDWKLGGLEYVSSSGETYAPPKILSSLSKYEPPEASKGGKSLAWSYDAWGFGCLIWEIFNGVLSSPGNLSKLGSIPKSLCPCYMELVASSPGKRSSPTNMLSKLKRTYFENDLITTITFLEELQIREEGDKTRFYSGLTAKLDNFPVHVCNGKILPQLINAFEFGNAGSAILSPVFKLGKNLETEEYQAKIVPCVVKLFGSTDRNARFKLLSQVEHFIQHLSNKVVNEEVFPQIQNGFTDQEPVIREKTVIAMIHLAPKLTYANLDDKVVLSQFSRLLRDEQPGIRTNTCVCLGKIAPYLNCSTRQKALISAFANKIKDPFPPARIAGINAFAATQQFYSLQETSSRVLPAICLAMSDPEKPVREQAFKVGRGFMEKLEKVSENPELREEMEKEVNSTDNNAVLSAASGWASWAVGALGAKFYKSNVRQPSSEERGKQSISNVSIDKDSYKSESKTEEVSWSDEDKTSKEVDNAGDGWDNSDDNGWDDDDEAWGSLEDDKVKVTPKKSDDFSNSMAPQISLKHKVDDGWSDGGSGWEDLNDDPTKAVNKIKQGVECKVAQRKEVQSTKRGAKPGPLKLGAKKL